MSRRWATLRRQASDLDDQVALAKCLWPQLPETDFEPGQYRHVLEHLRDGIADLETRASLEPKRARQAIVAVAGLKDARRSDVEAAVKSHYAAPPSDSTAAQAVETILRLWTMLDVQLQRPRHRSPPDALIWDDDAAPLTAVIKQHFDNRRPAAPNKNTTTAAEPDGDDEPIDAALTAAYLAAHHGIHVLWTSNLGEHLVLNGRVLKVFKHKLWAWNSLRYQHQAQNGNNSSSPIPADVLEELVDTWNLLFPAFDEATRGLLRTAGMVAPFYGLGYCGRGRTLALARYGVWGGEVARLARVLDEPQRGLQQFLRPDRKKRNALELAAFWLAGVVVLVLTFVGCVCGVLSLKYAVEQTDLSRRQLDLALATTCADPVMAARLPGFC
ncbi:hypothetical protein B0T26DRAFT_671664 [Lasiosphaeria miniovina]|uniref:Uncharacterized protein n=1 Tax=Lasiosphaeria miniovina TaxID=1954250 RepID=A0AA40B3E1_9PEZI|nr:uncharacterized protein B0T26DRAFT_671664 [Lasiosphaeria miniovina]KAK0726927.1 hypothetical protein B0T26DRAFT_671664 [Lasiosphaeria miniovina]